MRRIICIGLMALPAYWYDAEPSLASSADVPILTTSVISNSFSIKTRPNLLPWQLSSREDQTGDCNRDGSCRY